MKSSCLIISIAVFITSTTSIIADDNEFLPTAAPIPMTPSETAELKTGYGFNVINLKAEWKEDLLTANEEEIGDIDYESRNIVFGIQRRKSDTVAVESALQ